MRRRTLAIGLLLVGCGAEAPPEKIASTASAAIGAQLSGEYEDAPAYYGTVAFGANGSVVVCSNDTAYICAARAESVV